MVDLWFKDSEPRFPALQPGQTFLIKRERRTQGGVFGVSAAQMETPRIFLAVPSHRRERDKTQESGLQWLGDTPSLFVTENLCSHWILPVAHSWNCSFLGFWGGAVTGFRVGAALCCPHLSPACRWQVSS